MGAQHDWECKCDRRRLFWWMPDHRSDRSGALPNFRVCDECRNTSVKLWADIHPAAPVLPDGKRLHFTSGTEPEHDAPIPVGGVSKGLDFFVSQWVEDYIDPSRGLRPNESPRLARTFQAKPEWAACIAAMKELVLKDPIEPELNRPPSIGGDRCEDIARIAWDVVNDVRVRDADEEMPEIRHRCRARGLKLPEGELKAVVEAARRALGAKRREAVESHRRHWRTPTPAMFHAPLFPALSKICTDFDFPGTTSTVRYIYWHAQGCPGAEPPCYPTLGILLQTFCFVRPSAVGRTEPPIVECYPGFGFNESVTTKLRIQYTQREIEHRRWCGDQYREWVEDQQRGPGIADPPRGKPGRPLKEDDLAADLRREVDAPEGQRVAMEEKTFENEFDRELVLMRRENPSFNHDGRSRAMVFCRVRRRRKRFRERMQPPI